MSPRGRGQVPGAHRPGIPWQSRARGPHDASMACVRGGLDAGAVCVAQSLTGRYCTRQSQVGMGSAGFRPLVPGARGHSQPHPPPRSQNANFQNPRCENTPLIGRESPPPSVSPGAGGWAVGAPRSSPQQPTWPAWEPSRSALALSAADGRACGTHFLGCCRHCLLAPQLLGRWPHCSF